MRSVRHRWLSAALFLALAAWPRLASGVFIEQFPTDSDGWTASTINNGGAVHTSGASYGSITAGQLGYIEADVGSGGNRLFSFEPGTVSIFGSLTGLSLTTDYKISGTITGPDTPTVRFYVGAFSGGRSDYFVSSDAFSWDANSGSNWSTHGMPLLAGNFIEWPDSASHSRTFDQVIAAPEDIGLFFTGASGLFNDQQSLGFKSKDGAKISITNFGTVFTAGNVPEPLSLVLCTLSAALLLLKRRRAIV
jgi:hypothetical protein